MWLKRYWWLERTRMMSHCWILQTGASVEHRPGPLRVFHRVLPRDGIHHAKKNYKMRTKLLILKITGTQYLLLYNPVFQSRNIWKGKILLFPLLCETHHRRTKEDFLKSLNQKRCHITLGFKTLRLKKSECAHSGCSLIHRSSVQTKFWRRWFRNIT